MASNTKIYLRAKGIISKMPKGIKLTVDNVIYESLFLPGPSLQKANRVVIQDAIDYTESLLQD
jgi:hypothetical protein